MSGKDEYEGDVDPAFIEQVNADAEMLANETLNADQDEWDKRVAAAEGSPDDFADKLLAFLKRVDEEEATKARAQEGGSDPEPEDRLFEIKKSWKRLHDMHADASDESEIAKIEDMMNRPSDCEKNGGDIPEDIKGVE